MGELWRDMSDKAKDKYVKQAAKLKEEYEAKVAAEPAEEEGEAEGEEEDEEVAMEDEVRDRGTSWPRGVREDALRRVRLMSSACARVRVCGQQEGEEAEEEDGKGDDKEE